MAEIWEQNEEIDEETELVATNQRDDAEAIVEPDEEQEVQVTTADPREALDALGEDVASSPARRGHDNREGEADLDDDVEDAFRGPADEADA